MGLLPILDWVCVDIWEGGGGGGRISQIQQIIIYIQYTENVFWYTST